MSGVQAVRDSAKDRQQTAEDSSLLSFRRGAGAGQCAEVLRLHRTAGNAAVSGLLKPGLPLAVQSVLNSGGGRPLDPLIRSLMESTFGHDFSRVRIYTDARAAESAEAIHAFAYTVGRDVVFGKGQYSPGSYTGRRLIAHELTHTIQQRSGDRNTDEEAAITGSREACEEEADAAASAVAEKRCFVPSLVRSAGRLQRNVKGKGGVSETDGGEKHQPGEHALQSSWRTRVLMANGEPPSTRANAFVDLVNEALMPVEHQFPELKFPVKVFKSGAEKHGEVGLDTTGGEVPEWGKTKQLRAETLPSDEKLGTPPRIFIRMTPAALHVAEGPIFTQRVLAHEYRHFLSKLERKEFPPSECHPNPPEEKANPNKEVEIVASTFCRYFPTWATADKLPQMKNLSQVPLYIKEDLALLQKFFPCAVQEIRNDAIIRIATMAEDNPIRKRLLLRLVKLIRNAMPPSIGMRDNAMERLAAAVGDQPISRDPRIPEWTGEAL